MTPWDWAPGLAIAFSDTWLQTEPPLLQIIARGKSPLLQDGPLCFTAQWEPPVFQVGTPLLQGDPP
jgi:hypothetical protein